MSILDFLFGNKSSDNNTSDTADVVDATPRHRNADNYAFVDAEVGMKDHKVHDIGSLRHDGALFHNANKAELATFLQDIDYVCGHNIVHHDAKYLLTNRHLPQHRKASGYLSTPSICRRSCSRQGLATSL